MVVPMATTMMNGMPSLRVDLIQPQLRKVVVGGGGSEPRAILTLLWGGLLVNGD